MKSLTLPNFRILVLIKKNTRIIDFVSSFSGGKQLITFLSICSYWNTTSFIRKINTVQITSIEIILLWITFLILPSVRAFLMIKTDCAVHLILHPSFKGLSGKWFVRGDRWRDLCVCRLRGEVFWGGCSISGTHLQYNLMEKEKRERWSRKGLEEKEGERQT